MTIDYQYEVSDHLNNEISDHLEIQSPNLYLVYLVVMNIEQNFALGTEELINFPSFIPVTPVRPGLSPRPDLPLPSLFGRDIKQILPLETKSQAWAKPEAGVYCIR